MSDAMHGRGTRGPWRAGAAALLALSGSAMACAAPPSTRCTTVGRPGGLAQSGDTVLSIAIQPEALDEDLEFCIEQSDRPPEVYGPAYRVTPNPSLHFAASVSYRHRLPDDVEEVGLARVDADAFEQGTGEWAPMKSCRLEEDARQVRCSDDSVARFYGMIDDYEGIVTISDTNADGSSGDVTGGPTTDPTDPTDPTGGIEYPPECDALARGPFEPILVGPVFTPLTETQGPVVCSPTAPCGAEDMAPDGQGGFVGRSAYELVRLDTTGATLGMQDDPGFTIEPLSNQPAPDSTLFANSATLGIRYLANGDLVMMQRHAGTLALLHPDGTYDDAVVTGLQIPNGLHIDDEGTVWFTEFVSGRVTRYDPVEDDTTNIAVLSTANGIVFDPLRQVLFYVAYGNISSALMRVPISAAGNPTARPALVTMVQGASDGMAMDVCGNLYVVDQGGSPFPNAESRVDRLFLSDLGEYLDTEEIAAEIPAELSNASFGYGPAYDEFQTALFLTGTEGIVYYIDMQITGAPVPVLDAPPPTG